MSAPTETKQWILRERPSENPVFEGENSTFKLEKSKQLPELKEGQVLVKHLYLSNDPAQRTWISASVREDRLYVPPVKPGHVMRAGAIGEVIESRSSKLPKGTLITSNGGWSEYAVCDESSAVVIDQSTGLPVTHYFGAMGLPGYTAWYGLFGIAQTKASDVVVISGAAGAVGNMAVQIAKKIIGCRRVIGLAGTEDKCKWVEKLGADICLNYKDKDFELQLTKETDGFVDVYFDNVGGDILSFMLTRMARHGRVAACGAIADYNKSKASGIENWFEVITMRISIQGFICLDSLDELPEYRRRMTEEYKKGNIIIADENETVVDTKFEDIPNTWHMLFTGGNTGKLITKLT